MSGANDLYEGATSFNNPLRWLVRVVRTFGFEYLFRRYYGTYRGIVIDNEDPEERGRVRVQVPSLGHKTEDDVPPDVWALPKFVGLSVGKKRGQMHGVYFPADVGDQVWVEFEGGDPQFPIYCGGWLPLNQFQGDQLINTFALYKGIRTKSGHFVRFSDDPDDLHITIAKGDGDGVETGTFFSMTKDEEIIVATKNKNVLHMTADQTNLFAPDGGNMQLGAGKAVMMDARGNSFGLEGGKFQIQCDEATLVAAKKITLKSNVDIGIGPVYQPAVLGQIFSVLYNTHPHLTTVPSTPTSPQISAPLVKGNGLSLGVRVS